MYALLSKCHTPLLMVTVTSLMMSVEGQFPFSFSPDLSPVLQNSAVGISAFLGLWDFSLQVDKSSNSPIQRKSLEPKTLIVPGDLAMIHLVPQDVLNPLYLQDKKNSDLRREFLLNHLVLEPISPNNLQVSTAEGVTATTLSGRSVLIRKDRAGQLTVENVAVQDVHSLSDGTQVYRLVTPLFDLKDKVKKAFDTLYPIDITDAVGPPLVIPDKFTAQNNAGVRSPAPPPAGEVGPPALPPPSAVNEISAILKFASEKFPKAPAPPPGFEGAPFFIDEHVFPPAPKEVKPPPTPPFS